MLARIGAGQRQHNPRSLWSARVCGRTLAEGTIPAMVNPAMIAADRNMESRSRREKAFRYRLFPSVNMIAIIRRGTPGKKLLLTVFMSTVLLGCGY